MPELSSRSSRRRRYRSSIWKNVAEFYAPCVYFLFIRLRMLVGVVVGLILRTTNVVFSHVRVLHLWYLPGQWPQRTEVPVKHVQHFFLAHTNPSLPHSEQTPICDGVRFMASKRPWHSGLAHRYVYNQSLILQRLHQSLGSLRLQHKPLGPPTNQTDLLGRP